MDDATIKQWVDGYVRARDMEAAAKTAKNKYKQRIQDYMEDRGLEQLKVHGGAVAFFGEEKTRYSYTKENEDAMMDWLEANGYGGIIRASAHHMTLNKVLSEHEDQGGSLPEFVSRYEDRGFSVRRGQEHPAPPSFPGIEE